MGNENYGISSKKDVTEDHELIPITLYNKYKGLCEPILFNYTDENFEGVIFRPATVCGFSEKMRFDLTVNILTNFAIIKGFVKVFGDFLEYIFLSDTRTQMRLRNLYEPSIAVSDHSKDCSGGEVNIM